MDCLRTLCAGLGFLALAAGCDMKSFPLWPSSSPGPVAGKLPEGLPPRPEDLADQPRDLKPATLVAYANLKEKCAAEPDQLDIDRERLREAARQAYVRALEIDGKYIPAHLGLANWYDTVGNHGKAIATYQQVLKLAPKDQSVPYQLGMCHARHQEWEAAIDSLRKASEIDPDNRQCTKTLGMCLARAGHVDDSVACLEKVQSKAEAQCTVARMLYQMNQDEACKQHVQLALQLDPNLAKAKELLAELELTRRSAATKD
jgi:tetratricopeptide (TPR) repeat protein